MQGHTVAILRCLVVASAISVSPCEADEDRGSWAATWATSLQSAYVAPTTPQGASVAAYGGRPDLSFALPDATMAGATDQTFRLIVKPDLWGKMARIRLSNAFGTKTVTFQAASIGLQANQANVVPGTAIRVTFHGGASSVEVPAGGDVFSDAVELAFVEQVGPVALAGRNLAVSVAVKGSSGPISYHGSAFTSSYISQPNSGDTTQAVEETAFPFSTTSTFFLSEVDVMASPDTMVVAAFGDSITDGTFSTLGENDRWWNVMSHRLHDHLGARVSVVGAGIGGNAVTGVLGGQPAPDRLARDVLSLSGLKAVVWLEGINDIGGLGATPEPVIAGYQQVVTRLHANGVLVVGATLTTCYAPGGAPPDNSPLTLAVGRSLAGRYASGQTDAYRKQINEFILNNGLFDATADFSAATIDAASGTLQAPFVPNSEGSAGDYLHPNRFGHQRMGLLAADVLLRLMGGR